WRAPASVPLVAQAALPCAHARPGARLVAAGDLGGGAVGHPHGPWRPGSHAPGTEAPTVATGHAAAAAAAAGAHEGGQAKARLPVAGHPLPAQHAQGGRAEAAAAEAPAPGAVAAPGPAVGAQAVESALPVRAPTLAATEGAAAQDPPAALAEARAHPAME